MFKVVDRCWDEYFCLVNLLMSSLSILLIPSDNFSDNAIESAVSDTVAPDSGGRRKRLKFDGVPKVSQKKYPEYSAVAMPAWRCRGSFGSRLGDGRGSSLLLPHSSVRKTL